MAENQISETCENCGRVIGRLERPYVWRETSTVCRECHGRLSATEAPSALASKPTPPAPLPLVSPVPPGMVRCPHCSHVGQPVMQRRPGVGRIVAWGFIGFIVWLATMFTNSVTAVYLGILGIEASFFIVWLTTHPSPTCAMCRRRLDSSPVPVAESSRKSRQSTARSAWIITGIFLGIVALLLILNYFSGQ